MEERSRQGEEAVYEFGEFSLDVPERLLTRRCRRVHLAPKTYQVLVVLVTRANRLVTKRELLERVWPDVFVEAGILTVYVAHLRRALGDAKGQRRYIETVSGAGYRFIGPVTCRTGASVYLGEGACIAGANVGED